MTDADALARRYFALWSEYLTALVADPQARDKTARVKVAAPDQPVLPAPAAGVVRCSPTNRVKPPH